MEQNARNLAHAIRLLPEGAERQARIDTLRVMLEDIFELKQENRRREIEHLQRQIQEIQKNLRKREQMRDRMIDRHLRQLIDSTQVR
jgi:predicted RNase H-like nuclease (RuvC/YqgF family)